MHSLLLGLLLGPLTGQILAAPTGSPIQNGINARVEALTAPPPCQPMDPPPTEDETKARFDKFAHAFLVTKNITEAFTYINAGYINHNPMAKNGAASAWSILSPIWASQSITVLGTTFKGNMGWLHYRGSAGEVVDRYRWEAGCIAEHWDQGEKYPTTIS